MAVRRLLVTAVLLASVVALAEPRPGSVSDCSPAELANGLLGYQIVFIGTQSDPAPEDTPERSVVATFDVEAVIRGDVTKTAMVQLDPSDVRIPRDAEGREVVWANVARNGVIIQDSGCSPRVQPSEVEDRLALIPRPESAEPSSLLLLGELGWMNAVTLDRDGAVTGTAVLPGVERTGVICQGERLAFTGHRTIDIATLELGPHGLAVDGPVWCAGPDFDSLEIVGVGAGMHPTVTHTHIGITTSATFPARNSVRALGDPMYSAEGDVAMMWEAYEGPQAWVEIIRRGADTPETAATLPAGQFARLAALDPTGTRVAVTTITEDHRDGQADEIVIYDTTTGELLTRVALLDADGLEVETFDPVETFYPSYPNFGSDYERFSAPIWAGGGKVAIVREIKHDRYVDEYDLDTGERVATTKLRRSTVMPGISEVEHSRQSIAFFDDGELLVLDLPFDFYGAMLPMLDGPVVTATPVDIPMLHPPLLNPPAAETTTTTVEPVEPESAIEAPAPESQAPADAGNTSLILVAVIGLAAAGLGFCWSFRTPRKKR